MVIWYPITDFTVSLEKRVECRPKSDIPDPPVPVWGHIHRANIPASTDLKDPGLSPLYSDVDNFPKHMFMCAAEDDILLYDSYIMAEKLAGNAARVEDKAADRRMSCWTAGGITWSRVHKYMHAFNAVPKKGEAEVQRQKIRDEVYDKLVRWLCDDVLKAGGK